MKRALTIVSAAALAIVLATPSFAGPQQKRGYVRGESYRHAETHRHAPHTFADPSFGNRAGINYARQTGRCVADLGYGRYEYCGW